MVNFGDILVNKNLITQSDLNNVFAKSKESGIAVDKILESKGVSEDAILAAKAEASGVEARRVDKDQVSFDILKQIPEEAVRHYKFVPLGIEDGVLGVGMVNPGDVEAREALQFIVSKMNMAFKVYLIIERDFEAILEGYQGLRGEVTKALGELETSLDAALAEDVPEELLKDETRFVEEAPITKIVAVMLKHAIAGNASDIHIEPFKSKLRVRFRVDGVLYTSLSLPLDVHDAVVSRIKILTDMKLDEKRKPQDGRFGARIEGRDVDFRVSTFPVTSGEKVVIRILDKDKNVKNLEEVGLEGDQLEAVKYAVSRPYGLILLTGPTGSGKTTTLYAMLEALDKEKSNIVSLEDPVEYNVDGVSQSQIRPEIGYTFATGLRSILRQDPDMIMVGEIRDSETAALAIQAALTGHLVFSTLHTNNASGVIPRLVDMGIDPFLIAPTLLLTIAQRLVRTLCPNSKKEIKIEGKVKERIERELSGIPTERKQKIILPNGVYQGVPSEACPKGAKGRLAVFEILKKSPELEKIILSNPVDIEILKEGRRQGMLTMREETMVRVLEGTVGIEELNRI